MLHQLLLRFYYFKLYWPGSFWARSGLRLIGSDVTLEKKNRIRSKNNQILPQYLVYPPGYYTENVGFAMTKKKCCLCRTSRTERDISSLLAARQNGGDNDIGGGRDVDDMVEIIQNGNKIYLLILLWQYFLISGTENKKLEKASWERLWIIIKPIKPSQ